jgi:cytochrome P450
MEELLEEVIYDPYLPEKWPDPIPAYTKLLKDYPVYYLKKRDLWILTRYDDIMGALKDWKTYSSGVGGNVLEELPERVGNSLGTTDPPFHNQLRSVIGGVFTTKYISGMEDKMRSVVRDLINRFIDKRSFDAAGDFARLYTAGVVGDMIGIPEEDMGFFLNITGASRSLSEDDKNDPEKMTRFLKEMAKYCEKLVEKKIENPGNDVISMLLAAELNGKKMGVKEVSLASITLIGASLASTSMAITCSLATLHKHQDQLDEVRKDLSLIPAMIEEALRYDGSTVGFKRTTTRDVELHGKVIPKGSRVFLLYGAANHDEKYFPNPSKFDIHRENNRHLGFGWGVHNCLGAPIARQMLRIAYEELLPILGEFEIDYDNVQYSKQPQFRGYQVLPVSF